MAVSEQTPTCRLDGDIATAESTDREEWFKDADWMEW